MPNKRKKILAVTGIRSEYDILYPVIKCLAEDKRFEVKVVVSGAHLSDWHGDTSKIIEGDGFCIADRIDSFFMTNRVTQRAKAAGILSYSLSQTVEREKPDFLIVMGDREESIATALVGNYMDVLVAHIGGGDPVFGNADDPVRFAVSKLAHIHFTTTKACTDNLIKIGEEKFRVFDVGDPALDNIKNIPKISVTALRKALDFEISHGNYIVMIQHPLSSERNRSYCQMKTSLRAAEEFSRESGIKVVGVYPNTDPGSLDILRAIREYGSSDNIKFFKTLPRDVFINLMRVSLALLGNSSMGILESPFYKIPVVNVGNRQKGRLTAGNVEFVDFDVKRIKNALNKACFDKSYRAKVRKTGNLYGDGKSAEAVKNILLKVNQEDPKWHIKKKLC